MKLSEAVQALCIATRADGRSPATVTAYQRKLKPLVAFLDNMPAEQVTTNDLRRYIAHMWDSETLYTDHPTHTERGGSLSPHTIAGRVRALKRLFNWLEAEEEIQANPVRRIRTPRPGRKEPKAIEEADFLALLETTSGDGAGDRRDKAILLLLADSGIRVGGLCGIQVHDLDLEAGLASVVEKGDKARLIHFGPMTAQALKTWLEVRPDDQGAWVFLSLSTNIRGKLTPSGVIQMLKRRAKQAGITGAVNPHAFRHYFAREYLMNGGDLGTLADLLGHSSVEVTKSSYAVFLISELHEKHRRHSPVSRLFGDSKNDKLLYEEQVEHHRAEDS